MPCSSSITRIDGACVAGVMSGGLLLATGGGEIHGKGRSLTDLAVDQHQAAMRLDGALDDGEAESRASHASRRERLEQALPDLFPDAGTVVADAQRHGIVDPPSPKRARSEEHTPELPSLSH